MSASTQLRGPGVTTGPGVATGAVERVRAAYRRIAEVDRPDYRAERSSQSNG